MSTRVSWRCECGKNLMADRSASGFPFICPKCGKKARVPKQSSISTRPVEEPSEGELSVEAPAPRAEALHPAMEKFEVEEEPEIEETPPPKSVSSHPRPPVPPPIPMSPPTSVAPRYDSLRRASRWIRIYGWVILSIGAVWTLISFAIFAKAIV